MVYSWRQYYMEGKGQIQASDSLTPRGKKPSTPSIRLGMNARVGLEMLISATAGQRTQFYRSPNWNFSHYTAWSTYLSTKFKFVQCFRNMVWCETFWWIWANGLLYTAGVTTPWSRSVATVYFYSVALQPNAGHGLLILEVPRSFTTTYLTR
jgi:hypothetical protein